MFGVMRDQYPGCWHSFQTATLRSLRTPRDAAVQVNAAVDDAASDGGGRGAHAWPTARASAAPRWRTADRKRAQMLAVNVQVK